MSLTLPRLSSSAPIVSSTGAAAITLTRWWNSVCDAVEGAINSIEAQQSLIDQALGLANGAQGASDANTKRLEEISQALAGAGTVTKIVVGTGLTGTPATIVNSGTIALNLDSFSTTEGSILYRGASAWLALGPGTAGQKLTSGGAGAPPSWV